MAKKNTRSKRKELRAKGQLKPVDHARKAQVRQQEKRAEEEAVVARVHEAREEISGREDARVPFGGATKRTGRRDLTMLLVVALIGGAGVIGYLAMRGPSLPESSTATAAATPKPQAPASLAPHPVTMPAPPPQAEHPAPPPAPAPPPTAPAPAPATASPAPPPAAPAHPTAAPAAAPPAHPAAAPAPPPAAAPAAPPKPKPAKPKPAKVDDPYG